MCLLDPASDLGQFTGVGQLTVEQAPVSSPRDPNDPDVCSIQRDDDCLVVQRPLELVGQSKAHASHRLERRPLRLRLSQSEEIGTAANPIEQPAQIVFYPVESAGL